MSLLSFLPCLYLDISLPAYIFACWNSLLSFSPFLHPPGLLRSGIVFFGLMEGAIIWVFLSPPNPHVGILIPSVMVLGGGAWLGPEGGDLGNGISVLVKEALDRFP